MKRNQTAFTNPSYVFCTIFCFKTKVTKNSCRHRTLSSFSKLQICNILTTLQDVERPRLIKNTQTTSAFITFKLSPQASALSTAARLPSSPSYTMASTLMNKAKDAMGIEKDTVVMAGHKVHNTGYGLMGLTWRAEPPPKEQSFAAMRAALDAGANLWNGGELYGTPEANSLHLLREYFQKYPEDAKKVVICIKGGLEKGGMKPVGTTENTRRSIDECLAVLGTTKKLDLWEAARVDPTTPIEVTMRAADEYVKSGKLGGISLSECSADTIRRAAKVTKISAVEVEFSLWETTILENGVAKACEELEIPIVAYSPLGRGFLTGQIKSFDDFPEGDFRRHVPRFQGENFDKNLALVKEIEKLAEKKGCTPGQLAIAWVKAQSGKPGLPVIVPIPGASAAERVKENLVDVKLSENDLKEIDSLVESAEVHGDRYGGPAAALCFGDSPEEN